MLQLSRRRSSRRVVLLRREGWVEVFHVRYDSKKRKRWLIYACVCLYVMYLV